MSALAPIKYPPKLIANKRLIAVHKATKYKMKVNLLIKFQFPFNDCEGLVYLHLLSPDTLHFKIAKIILNTEMIIFFKKVHFYKMLCLFSKM